MHSVLVLVSVGKEITADLWDKTVRDFLKTNEPTIEYDTDDLRLKFINKHGILDSVRQFEITNRTTVDDICKSLPVEANVFKIKDGIVCSIVSPRSKATKLTRDDKYDYGLYEYDSALLARPTGGGFFICVQFIGNWRKSSLHHMLVEMGHGESLSSLGCRLVYKLQENMDLMNLLQYELENDDLLQRDLKANETPTFVQPKNKDIVPLVKVKMIKNKEKTRKCEINTAK